MKVIATLIFSILLAACSKEPTGPTVKSRWYAPSQVSAGASIFQNHCAVCHGAKAEGLADDWKKTLPDGSYPPPPLDGTAHAWHHPISVLLRTIRQGGVPLGGKMPGFEGKLSEQEQLAVIAYFQSYWSDEIYSHWLELGGTEK